MIADMATRLLVSICCFFPVLFAAKAHAAGCEANFERRGHFPDRHLYFSSVDIAGLTAGQAFDQIRKIFADMGIRITNEDRPASVLKAELPATLFTETQHITVRYGRLNDIGNVQMAQTVNPGVIMTGGIMRRQICMALNRLAGPIAPRAASLPKGALIQPISATELARKVQQARENPARIKTLFSGRQFRVTGLVERVSETHNGYAVEFEGISVPTTLVGNKENTTLRVVCYIPKARATSAAALYPNASGTLTGRFYRIENHSLMPEINLDDCGT